MTSFTDEKIEKELGSAGAQKMEKVIDQITKICNKNNIGFIGCFCKFTDDDEGIQIRSRVIGATEQGDPNYAANVPLLWAGLNQLENIRQTLEKKAHEEKLDLNKYLGKPVKTRLPGLPS